MKKIASINFGNRDNKKLHKKCKNKLNNGADNNSTDGQPQLTQQLIHAYQAQPQQLLKTPTSPFPQLSVGQDVKPCAKSFTFQFTPSFKAPPTPTQLGPDLAATALLPTTPYYAMDDAAAHYYYSIAELENLNMLDHRHPQFHQHHRTSPQQQQQQQLKLYQHHKLVLRLPNAGTSANVAALAAPTSPIYQAPQIVTLPVNHSSDNNSQHNTNKDSDKNTSNAAANTLSLINNISMNDVSNAGNIDTNVNIDNKLLLHAAAAAAAAAGSMPIDILLRQRALAAAPTAAAPIAKATVGSLLRRQSSNTLLRSNTTASTATNNNNNCSKSKSTNSIPSSLLRSHSLHPHAEMLPAATVATAAQRQHNSVKAQSAYNFAAAADIADFLVEQSIIGARASVMVYDDNQKKWVPSGSSSGLSKVQIYHHQQNNTFRVVGRKLQDHEVVINCSILKGLKYNQATATFHQWRDSKFVYGLNFSSQHDAEAFARAMMHALEVLSGRVANNPAGQPTNGNGYEEDMGYRTMTSEDAAILRQQQQITGQVTPSAQTPTSQTNQNNIPQSPPTPQQGHHRTSRNSLSAPPAPQPQQMSMPPQQQQQQQQPQQQQQQQQQQQLYGQTGNGPTQNGIMLQQQPQQQQQPQIPPAPTGQTQYHAPQQQMQQQQPPQQSQQHHTVYSSQQLVNQTYQQQQQQNQYQQPHYVLSSSNPNLNLHQYSQQQPGVSQPPMPPPHQQNGPGGGPIYVSSQPPPPPQGIPTSASSNSVVYASQQQMIGGGGAPMPPQPPTMLNGPPAPPQPNAAVGGAAVYGHLNGPQAGQPENPYGQVPPAPPMMAQSGGVPMPPPLNRMSSGGPAAVVGAPSAPPPPPTFGGAPPAPQMFNGNAAAPPPPQPPAPPAPPAMGAMAGGPGAPPPPPPPPMGGMAAKSNDPTADLMGSLAAQLQMAKLKKNKSSPLPTENSGSSTSSGGSGNYGTIGRSSNGMASMMDEMAKTLARRRAQAEKKEPEPEPEVKQRPWEKSNTLPHKLGSNSSNGNSNSRDNTSNSGSESPRPIRKRFGSASEETILKQVNGDGLSLALSGDLDSLKAEIVREMRLEIQKVKQEIIDAIKSEFNRR